MKDKKIILACDYRGVELRDYLYATALNAGLNVKDIGIEAGSKLDYVDITHSLIKELNDDPDAYGVLVCGSGQGVAIVANRYPHIRATMCRTPDDAISVRSKLNANVMTLGSKYTSEADAFQCMLRFLETPFKQEKHGYCVSKIDLNNPAEANNTNNLNSFKIGGI